MGQVLKCLNSFPLSTHNSSSFSSLKMRMNTGAPQRRPFACRAVSKGTRTRFAAASERSKRGAYLHAPSANTPKSKTPMASTNCNRLFSLNTRRTLDKPNDPSHRKLQTSSNLPMRSIYLWGPFHPPVFRLSLANVAPETSAPDSHPRPVARCAHRLSQ